MTSERASALAAARRRGLSLEQTGFRFAEIPLESEDARRRADTIPEADGAAEDATLKRFLAKRAAQPAGPEA
jgi:hypothetical protein